MRRYTCQDHYLNPTPCTSHIRLIREGGGHLAGSLTSLCINAIETDLDCSSGSHHTVFHSVTGVFAPASCTDTSLLSVTADLARQLDCGVIPELLRTRLAQRGIQLSEQASVAIRQCSQLWVVTDPGCSFLIRKRSSKLVVFQDLS